MADLTWGDVVLIGLVAFLGFTLLSYWYSAVMARKGQNWQVKGRKRRAAK